MTPRPGTRMTLLVAAAGACLFAPLLMATGVPTEQASGWRAQNCRKSVTVAEAADIASPVPT